MVFDQEQHERVADFTVHVDPTDGWIYLDGVRMTQRDAVDLAAALVQGVQRSIDRYQMDRPSYYDTAQILARSESALGRALTALTKVFG